MEVQGRFMQARFIQIHQVFAKENKVGYFTNRPRMLRFTPRWPCNILGIEDRLRLNGAVFNTIISFDAHIWGNFPGISKVLNSRKNHIFAGSDYQL